MNSCVFEYFVWLENKLEGRERGRIVLDFCSRLCVGRLDCRRIEAVGWVFRGRIGCFGVEFRGRVDCGMSLVFWFWFLGWFWRSFLKRIK